MEIYTAGFTRWSAREFFDTLTANGVERVVDVRLHNSSQLAGFAKRDDLAYFLERIVGASYAHEPLLAPTDEILKPYKRGELEWSDYESEFLHLLDLRAVADRLPAESFLLRRSLLLCSEHEPDRCHRRLIVEYLQDRWGAIDVVHLHR